MKCVLVVACGLADEPIADLGGKTPLEAARTPNLDAMAAGGILGLTRTAPRGVRPGCETGVLALLGYEPAQYRASAAALEALGLGVTLGPEDVALRANLVTLDLTEDGTEVLGDPMGGRLPVAEASVVARDLAAALADREVDLVPGLGHRHVLVWRRGSAAVRTTSPYELIDKPVAGARPSGPRSDVLTALIDRSKSVLAAEAVCAGRRARAERVPTALWPWDPGTAVSLPTLHDAFGVDGALVAAAPLVRGIGVAAGLVLVDAPGATGDLDTNLASKVEAALGALADHDLVVLHVAAADVAGHAGDGQRKSLAIERLDEVALGPLVQGLRGMGGDWRVLVVADHATPCAARVHGAEPVPFVVYTDRNESKVRTQKRVCSEKDAREQGIFIPEAHTLVERLLRR